MKNHSSFSKLLLIQESVLIWIITITFLVLAFVCVSAGFVGSLPWLAAMVSFPWTAYGVSQAFYYNKSKKENTEGGIVFENMRQNFYYENKNNNDEIDLNGPI